MDMVDINSNIESPSLFSEVATNDAIVGCPHARATYGKTPSHWDIECVQKILCQKDSSLVTDLSKLNKIKIYDKVYWDDPIYDGTKWTTKRFPGGGYNDKNNKEIGLVTDGSCEQGAVIVKHELIHQSQPAMLSADAEDDAYLKAEEWAIDHDLPSQAPPGYNFRKWQWSFFPFPWPREVPNKDEIQRMVRDKYPVPPAKTGPPPPQVVGKTPSGDTIEEDPNTGVRIVRPPRKGDSYPGPQTSLGEQDIDPKTLKCP